MKSPFDTEPLTAPLRRRAVRANADEVSRAYPYELPRQDVWSTAMFVFAVTIGITFAIAFAVYFLKIDNAVLASIAVLAPFPIGLVATFGVIAWRRQRVRVRWYRLRRFAEANDMTFVPAATLKTFALHGTAFRRGIREMTTSTLVAIDVVSVPQARNLRMGSVRKELGTGRNRSRYVTDFAALDLHRPLPHIVLDARANDRIRSGARLGAEFTSDQRLSLEGDFDAKFRLYCPAGYETDALYLFTPDVMTRLQDFLSYWDIEIYRNTLYLTTAPGTLGADPEAWQLLGEAINALAEKLDQWERWRESAIRSQNLDDGASRAEIDAAHTAAHAHEARLAARGERLPVAPAGRRLKLRMPWWLWVLAVASVGLTLWFVATIAIGLVVDIVQLFTG